MSRRALARLLLLSLLAVLSACTPKSRGPSGESEAFVLPGESETPRPGLVHRVRASDSWDSIALEYYGDASRAADLRRANRRLRGLPAAGGELYVPMDSAERAAFARRSEARAPYNRGLEHARAGRYPEAILEFQAALDIDPALAPAHYNLGLVYRLSGRPALAAVSLARACELEDRQPDYLYAWGSTLADLGEPREAEARYRRALSVDPDHLASLYALARALDARGRSRDAQRYWQRLLELAPESLRGREAARRLGTSP